MPDPFLSLAGKVGSYSRWSKEEDRSGATAPARAAFEARFEKFPDPAAARKAFFLRLALASAKARRARKAGAA